VRQLALATSLYGGVSLSFCLLIRYLFFSLCQENHSRLSLRGLVSFPFRALIGVKLKELSVGGLAELLAREAACVSDKSIWRGMVCQLFLSAF
jgi:hypothetical protein